MAHSLRWKLLGWYAATQLAMVVAFAAALLLTARRAAYLEIDGRLRAEAAALASALRAEGGGAFYLELSAGQVEQFRDESAQAAYYRIWSGDGALVDTSHPDLDVPRPHQPGARDRGDRREASVAGPDGSLVLVGRGVTEDKRRLRALVATVALAGVGTALLTLGGAWFLAGRALAPLDRISRSAAAVSASNLTQRIDPARMESEMHGLASTINSAFDRLQLALERQTRFTADASHELRTPLSVVLSQADHALMSERTPEQYREALETVRRAGRRMQSVVEGLLTLARADAGGVTLRATPVELDDVVRGACDLLAPLAARRSVALIVRTETATVSGDRDLLADVVSNLVTNAIVYNREGGRVEVVVRALEGDALLTVDDTGIGIPPADRPRVFERFYRSDKARSRVAGGNGLGLAIAKWIVDAHNGSIDFESVEGAGTRFTVRIARRQ